MGELIFIGLGMFSEKDITIKGLEEAKNCDVLFAEFYTAAPSEITKDRLEKLLGKKINILGREEVEKGAIILCEAKQKRVGFLVPGDPMTATTHIELRLRAIDLGIKTKITHGQSVLTAAAGLAGLQHYKFGKVTTIPFPQRNYFPTSPYDTIKKNKENGLHTLVLLDLRPEENKCMTANEGMSFLLEIEEIKKNDIFTKETLVCVVARAGSESPKIKAGLVKDLINEDFGPPMHCLIVPSALHFMEEEALRKIAGWK